MHGYARRLARPTVPRDIDAPDSRSIAPITHCAQRGPGSASVVSYACVQEFVDQPMHVLEGRLAGEWRVVRAVEGRKPRVRNRRCDHAALVEGHCGVVRAVQHKCRATDER